MEKYVHHLTDFAHRIKVGEDDYIQTDNIKGFSLPDIEPGTNEISGYSGLNGTLTVMDWANIQAMEMSLKFSTIPEKTQVMKPGKQQHQLVWTEQYEDKEQNTGWMTFKAYITANLKKTPGGDYSKGETGEREFTYAVKAYRLVRINEAADGTVTEEELINYDPVNKKLVLGGDNIGEKMTKPTASF